MSNQFEEDGWVESSAAPVPAQPAAPAGPSSSDLARSRRALPQNIDAEQSVLAA